MKRLMLSLVLSLSFLSISAQEWEVVFDDIDNSLFINDVCKVDDDCLFIGASGAKYSEANGLVLKMSSNGEYETRIFSEENSYSKLLSIVRLDDGNFFIVGWLKNFHTDSIYIWNIVMDEEMNIIRDKKHLKDHRSDDISDGYCVKRNNGNIVFTCRSEYMPPTARSYGCYIVEFDTDCNMLKSNLLDYSTGYLMFGYSPNNIFEIPGSDEIIVLGNGFDGAKSIMYFDSDLSYERSVLFNTEPSVSLPEGYGILVDDTNIKLWLSAIWYDNKYHKSGAVVGNYNIQTETMSIQTELLSGNPYDTVYYASQLNKGMAKTTDGKLLCYGFESVNYEGTPRLFIFDENENLTYSIFFEDYKSYYSRPMLSTSDGGCLLVMCKWVGNGMITIIKKISNETLSVNEHASAEDIAEVYPNPAREFIQVQLNDDGESHQITIYDVYGKAVIVTDDLSGKYSTAYVGNLKPGVYLYQVTGKNQVIKKGKFIKI